MRTLPFASEHVAEAAAVLADVHAMAAVGAPGSSYAEPSLAQEAVAGAAGRGPGVVAVEDGAVVGYMVAPLPNVPGPSSSRLRPADHAARPEVARAAYRAMYEAVAGPLVAAGCTYHSIPVSASEPDALQAFFELEFGVDQIQGFMTVAEAPRQGLDHHAGGMVRPASADDLDGLIALAIELQKFHARPPMFQPALLPVPGIRASLVQSLEEATHAVLVAEDNAGLTAMMQAEPHARLGATVSIGMNVVASRARSAGVGTSVLHALLAWAVGQGYRHCTVGWTSSNPVSDPFYRSRGFRPLRYRLHRRIDTRVSWANESLDYRAFALR